MPERAMAAGRRSSRRRGLRIRGVAALLVAAASAAAAAAAPAGAGEGAPAGVDAERAAALERLVRQDCGSCHGMRLSGGLGPDIRAAALAGVPAGAVAEIILDGLPGTAMPPWRPLISEEDAAWIADYLKRAGAK